MNARILAAAGCVTYRPQRHRLAGWIANALIAAICIPFAVAIGWSAEKLIDFLVEVFR